MSIESYLLGTKISAWKENSKLITFVVTEDCNLQCRYCYMTGKNSRNKMTFETAKKAIDYILSHPENFSETSVVWEFIGGEPFLEIDLIDKICDYIKIELYRLNHKWFNNYRFNFSSNGLLYNHPKVQNYIEKNKYNVNIGLSIDGNKIKHDLQRVKADGSGSYDDIMKNVPLWLKQFPETGTKATFASSDLPYLKDSVMSLWDNGITNVAANVIFENDWKEDDDLIFENQLKELADYIIDNQLWDKYNATLFSDNIGFPLTEGDLHVNWCGAGKMLAINHEGNFYPCVRFVDYSLNNRDGYIIGDSANGYDLDKVRAFKALTTKHQSTEECLNCPIATGCAWCQGLNYDEAEIDSIYERATYICKMHKARVRANDYYWARLKNERGIRREVNRSRRNYLYFVLSNQSARHCTYETSDKPAQMSLETFKKGIEYAKQNFYIPILLLPPEGLTSAQKELLSGIETIQIYADSQGLTNHDSIAVYDNSIDKLHNDFNSILIVSKDELTNLSSLVQELFAHHSRINLVLDDIELYDESDLNTYEEELDKLVNFIANKRLAGGDLNLNVLTDRPYLEKMANCNSGIDSFALGPDGNLYPCPAFYFDEDFEPIGNLEDGIVFKYQNHFSLEKSPLCSKCDAYQCRRCVYQNKKLTREYLVPSKNQCVISHLERKMSKKLFEILVEKGAVTLHKSLDELIPDLTYLDPIENNKR